MESTQSRKGYRGVGMEGAIARRYARDTGKIRQEYRDLAARLSAEVPERSRILEVAPGPGYLSIELAKTGRYEVSAMDISETMVRIAQENAKEAGAEIDFRVGNAAKMPFADGSFDFVVCRAAFKNFTEPVKALDEMYRVLREGGRALIIDMRRDASDVEIDSFIAGSGWGWWDSLVSKLIFRWILRPRAYSEEQIRCLAGQTRFGGCELRVESIGYEATLVK